MSTEATTPAPTATPAGGPAEGGGTAQADVKSPVGADSKPVSDTNQDPAAVPEIKYDLSKIPPAFHDVIKAELERVNNEHRSNYTKKYQEFSAERKRAEEVGTRLTATEKNNQEILKVAKEVLSDPTNAKLHEYRQKLGYQAAPAETPAPNYGLPENPTLGDVLKVMEQMVEQKVNGVKNYADNRTNESIADYERRLRWEGAEKELRKDPVGNLYAEEISYAAMNTDKYIGQYRQGKSESQVLQQVLEDFKAKRNKDLDQERQGWLSAQEKKKGETTLQPTPGSGVLTPASKQSLTDDQIIANMRATFGLV